MPYDRITQAAIDVLVGRGSGTVNLHRAVEAKHPGAVARARATLKRERFERKFKGSPPAWVKRFVEKHGRGEVRSLAWHRSRVGTFHGVCDSWGDISVTTPVETPVDDDRIKMLVLHEIAHALDPYDRHGDRFYDHWTRLLKAESLYRRAISQYGGRRAGSLRAASRRAA